MDAMLNPGTISALQEFEEPGKKDFLTEIITAYTQDTAVRFQSLWAAHQSGQPIELGKMAHAIKGSSLNVGADPLSNLMRAIEMQGKSGVLTPSEKIEEAEAMFRKVCEALKIYTN